MIVRRVVTGHDSAAKSVFLSDGHPPRSRSFVHTPGFDSNPVWLTDGRLGEVQGREADPTITATSLHAEPGGSVFLVISFPPDTVMTAPEFDMANAWPEHIAELPGIAERFEPDAPGMHRTDTLDYVIVLSGEITLELDDRQTRSLSAGDVVIQQGTRHAWRNPGTEPATLAFCMLGRG